MTETLSKKKVHLVQVDYVRAFASLLVAIFHLGGKVVFPLSYGWLGVEMFFVLSGFIICWALPLSYNYKDVPSFLAKRLIRIEPPYIFSIGCLLVLNYLTKNNYKPDWINVGFHLAYINNFIGKSYLNPVYWTLGIEFQYYILIALIFPILLRNWGKWLIVIFNLIPFIFSFPDELIFTVFPIFAFGVYAYYFLAKKITFNELLAWLILNLVICYFQLGLLKTAVSLFSMVAILLPIQGNKIVTFFSKISFSLYLTHDIFGSRLVIYLDQFLPRTFFFRSLVFTIGLLTSILIAYAFYRLIEVPFLKLSKRISYKPKPEPIVSDFSSIS